MQWHRVASHLRLPVAELRTRITYTEFLGWLAFLKWDEERRTKLDFYLVQIAAEVRRGYVEHPKKVKLEDFWASWEAADPQRQERAQKSKEGWFRGLNLKLQGN